MTTEKLFNLIAKAPMMRTVQIADRLDISVEDADALLRQGLQAGHIIEHEVDAPNNRKAMAYELSAQYMAANALVAAPRAAEPRTPAPQPAAPPNVSHEMAARGLTKVERAIAYVRKNGPASSAQLHKELELSEGVHVSSYLGSAVRTGRLARDGQTWSMPGPAAIAPANIPKFSTLISAPAAVDLVQTVQPATVEAALENPVIKAFRCGLWSDGTFEIQRNGATVATLHPDEHDTVLETLQRARAA